jgi:hypothetical protein
MIENQRVEEGIGRLGERFLNRFLRPANVLTARISRTVWLPD